MKRGAPNQGLATVQAFFFPPPSTTQQRKGKTATNSIYVTVVTYMKQYEQVCIQYVTVVTYMTTVFQAWFQTAKKEGLVQIKERKEQNANSELQPGSRDATKEVQRIQEQEF